jgi:hypothetical protein
MRSSFVKGPPPESQATIPLSRDQSVHPAITKTQDCNNALWAHPLVHQKPATLQALAAVARNLCHLSWDPRLFSAFFSHSCCNLIHNLKISFGIGWDSHNYFEDILYHRLRLTWSFWRYLVAQAETHMIILKISCSTGWDSHDYCTGWYRLGLIWSYMHILKYFEDIFWILLAQAETHIGVSFGTGWDSDIQVLGTFLQRPKDLQETLKVMSEFSFITPLSGAATLHRFQASDSLWIWLPWESKSLSQNTSCCKLTYTHKRTGDLNWCKLVAYHALSDALLHRRPVF